MTVDVTDEYSGRAGPKKNFLYYIYIRDRESCAVPPADAERIRKAVYQAIGESLIRKEKSE